MDSSLRWLLEDARKVLKEIEWGGRVSHTQQCPSCGKMYNVRPVAKHNRGCKLDSTVRRIDAVLKGE